MCAVHMADSMMADYVKLRDAACRSCGGMGSLDWAHCHSRRYRSIRWDPTNSVALCRRCHVRYTAEPSAWEQWCRDNGIAWDELRYRAFNEAPMRPLDVIERLRAAA